MAKWLMENWELCGAVLTAVVALGAAASRFTETDSDDKFWAKLGKALGKAGSSVRK